MPRGKAATDTTTLQMALVGYEMEKQKIEQKIREIQGRLGGKRAAAAGPALKKKGSKRKPLSAAARKRIAAAQKRRWAEHRKAQAAKGA